MVTVTSDTVALRIGLSAEMALALRDNDAVPGKPNLY